MRTWADDVEDQRRERDREQRRLIECQHGALFSHCEICKRDARIAELEAALRALLSGCTRYDENPESLVACAAYDEGVAVARKALQE